MSAISPVTDECRWDCHVHVFEAGVQVLPGHYQPVRHDLAQLRERARGAGVERFVLVQPSVYGSDNRVLLQALDSGNGADRGVVVLDRNSDPGEIGRLHRLGVRGIRFNRRSPVGLIADPDEVLARWGDAMRDYGWHVQWYLRPEDLQHTLEVHRRYRLPCVLDHLGGFDGTADPRSGAWQCLQELAGSGAWIKASAWYRMQASAPYEVLRDLLLAVTALFEDRMVWGSDWPHTNHELLLRDPYELQLAPLSWLGADQADRICRDNPKVLYR